MKRTIVLLLALMMLLPLAACSEGEGTGGEAEREIDTNRSFMQNNTMVYSTETEDTIYFAGYTDSYIKYVDKQTGAGGVLCGKPECQHNSSDCNAYMLQGWCFFNDGQRLYWLESVDDASYATALYSAALDGTDRKMETGLPRGLLSGSTSYQNYILKDGYLYLGCVLGEIEDGVQIKYNYMVAFPMDDEEKPYVILKEKTEASQFYSVPVHAYGDSLYFMTSNLDGTWELADETDTFLYNFKLRRYDLGSGEIETLYELDRTTLSWMPGMWALDDGLVFSTYSKDDAALEIFKYNFENGECGEMFECKAEEDLNTNIMDHLICSYRMLNHEGVYDFKVAMWDFDGNKIVDETYVFDQREVYAYYMDYHAFALGRDEENAYFAFTAPGYAPGHPDNGRYTTVIAVALDGSGAEVMCTVMEDR